MKFKHFNIEDVLSPDDINQAEKYIGQKGYYADSLESFDRYIEDKEHIDYLYSVKKSNIFTYFVIGYSWGTCGFCNYFLPLEKVKKTEQTEQTMKQKSTENRNTFDLWIANKVKVRVVTTALDYDNTFFSILGVIEKCEKQGILLKDQNNKEQFICFPNILEVQNLGTDDWKEYIGLSLDEIGNFWNTDEN